VLRTFLRLLPIGSGGVFVGSPLARASHLLEGVEAFFNEHGVAGIRFEGGSLVGVYFLVMP
jgi:hypothetical protein